MKTITPSNTSPHNDSKNKDSDSWKSKYYGLLKELELQERNWGEMEVVLRRSLSRMTALGTGQSALLDTHLNRLRQSIREEMPSEQLAGLVEDMIDLCEPLENETVGEFTDAGLDSTNSRHILALLLEILALPGNNETQDRKRYDWQQQLRQPTTSLNSLAMEIIQELGTCPVAKTDLYSITTDALRSLLDQLPLPDTLQLQIQRIRQQLDAGLDQISLTQAITKIADLARAAQSDLQQQRQELERFLLQLTQRLRDMDLVLADSSEHSRRGLQTTREMNQAVQSEMAGISSQVETAEELGELKKTVQQHLMRIEKRLNDHIEGEVELDHKHRRHIEQLVSRLGEMEEETRHLRLRVSQERARALTDKLTGVSNRLAFDERLEQELTRWKRYKNPLSLVFWDIDHFKQINDQLGHKAGDKILQALGALLNKRLRESDFTARFGGEEFISLLPEELSAAAKVADEIRAAIASFKFNYQGKRVPMSISCGVTQCREGDTASTLIERADHALYKAKEGGRNRCEVAV